jgi:hypothetical protein
VINISQSNTSLKATTEGISLLKTAQVHPYGVRQLPNVIDHQAYRFIGKIRMRLAASGAPIAVKRRAVNKGKNLPVGPHVSFRQQDTRCDYNVRAALRLGAACRT